MGRTVMTNFTAGSKAVARQARVKAEAPVPQGTVKEVIAWAGDDATRAQRALDAENSYDEPRVTVLDALEKVIENA